MSGPSPAPTTQRSPLGHAAQQDGIVVTQMLIVADVERSVSFYRDVLGATVGREHSPAMLRFHNGWLVINRGGGPTPDKPEVTMTPPEDLKRVSTLMNIRVADIATVYREWNERGAQFLTEPMDNHGAEQRCYLRDPDGYLIELGATTPRALTA
jgi:lactoylglutathione lyase